MTENTHVPRHPCFIVTQKGCITHHMVWISNDKDGDENTLIMKLLAAPVSKVAGMMM